MGIQKTASRTAERWAVRVPHPDRCGIRISLGTYPSYEQANAAQKRFLSTGHIPQHAASPSFKDVHGSGTRWYCDYEGETYGPFKSQAEAAWRRRRFKDNATQRDRRATPGGKRRYRRAIPTKRESVTTEAPSDKENLTVCVVKEDGTHEALDTDVLIERDDPLMLF
jgi:hypothetical protein